MFQPHLILHPTDYSDCARCSLGVAVSLAAQYRAKLLILHVAATLGAEGVSVGEAMSELQPEGHQRRLWEEFRRRTTEGLDGVTVERVLTAGEPGPEIVRVANEQHVDLIVMGTHGRRALDRWITGSVTEKVVHLASCPVLTVREPALKPPPR
jgi:nucleotide-binding universal stress UspA family protein